MGLKPLHLLAFLGPKNVKNDVFLCFWVDFRRFWVDFDGFWRSLRKSREGAWGECGGCRFEGLEGQNLRVEGAGCVRRVQVWEDAELLERVGSSSSLGSFHQCSYCLILGSGLLFG